jgi:hypothetical protein
VYSTYCESDSRAQRLAQIVYNSQLVSGFYGYLRQLSFQMFAQSPGIWGRKIGCRKSVFVCMHYETVPAAVREGQRDRERATVRNNSHC